MAVSGEELTSIPVDELVDADAGTLKQDLQKLCKWPKSMMKLLHDGEALDDDVPVSTLTDVQVVLLPFDSNTSSFQEQLTSALVEAAAEGEMEVVTQLLEAGADMNRRNQLGMTPLNSASEEGQLDMVHFLMDAGADKDPRDGGQTPLCSAGWGQQEEVVALLLKAGVNPDRGQPIIIADDSGNAEIVDMLVRAGASTDVLRSHSPPLSPPRFRSFGSGSSF